MLSLAHNFHNSAGQCLQTLACLARPETRAVPGGRPPARLCGAVFSPFLVSEPKDQCSNQCSPGNSAKRKDSGRGQFPVRTMGRAAILRTGLLHELMGHFQSSELRPWHPRHPVYSTRKAGHLSSQVARNQHTSAQKPHTIRKTSATSLAAISKAPRREEGQCWKFTWEMLGSAPPNSTPTFRSRNGPLLCDSCTVRTDPTPSLSTPWRELRRRETHSSQQITDSDQCFSTTSPDAVPGATALLRFLSCVSIMMTTC